MIIDTLRHDVTLLERKILDLRIRNNALSAAVGNNSQNIHKKKLDERGSRINKLECKLAKFNSGFIYCRGMGQPVPDSVMVYVEVMMDAGCVGVSACALPASGVNWSSALAYKLDK